MNACQKTIFALLLFNIFYINIHTADCTTIVNSITGENDGDQTGTSVALSADGTILAEGEPLFDGNKGIVRTFIYSGDSWVNIGNITGQNADDTAGSSLALSADGNILAVGEPGYANGSNDGRVRTFLYNGSSWSGIGNIQASSTSEKFGSSIALNTNGTIIAVGAPDYFQGDTKGAVSTFIFTGGSWTALGNIIEGENVGDKAGSSVALNADGNILAEGEIGYPGGSNFGRVRTFIYNGSSWSGIGEILGIGNSDEAGSSVALNAAGNILAEGEPGFGSNSGRVRTFVHNESSWSGIGDINGENASDFAGISVALNANGLLLAEGEYGFDGSSGRVRTFEYDGTSWVNVTNITGENPGDRAGWSVALNFDGSMLAEGETDFDSNKGRVRTFKTSCPLAADAEEIFLTFEPSTSYSNATSPGGKHENTAVDRYLMSLVTPAAPVV